MNEYDLGDRRKLICEVRDENNDLVDPTVLTFYLRDPNEEVYEYVYGTNSELVKDSTGLYHVYWDCEIPGRHDWRYEATGNVAAAEESYFTVKRSIFRD